MELIKKLLKNIRLTYCYVACITLCLISNVCFAQAIIIPPNTVISHSKTYNNVTLDMTKGSFIIRDNATLTINNSIITGNISQTNPVLITVEKGALNLTNSQMNVKAVGINPHPDTQSEYHAIQVSYGAINMNGNNFQIDQPFTAGLLITDAMLPTSNFNITNNRFEGFHGLLYLVSTNNALVANNTLVKNTYGNIVIIGSNSKIINNTIYFSGNNRLGDSIDVIDSNNILVSKNILLTPSCHGVYVYNSSNVVLDQNRITGGITYGVNVLSFPEKASKFDSVSHLVSKHKMKHTASSNITISNNVMSQNRYGVAATDVNGLTVSGNIFIQRFEDHDTRQFWTNNNILILRTTNVTWSNNQYKEGYTQEMNGDNSKSSQIIPFPATGGVSL